MKIAAFVLLACAAAFAGDTPEIKKLGAVTWHPDTHKLTWVVETGTIVNGEFVAKSELQYEVSPHEAFMALGEEQRGIDDNEAVAVHKLLDTLAFYCAESVAWWVRGKGVPIDPSNKPTPKKA